MVIDIAMTGQTGLAHVTWELHPDDHHKINGERASLGATETARLKLVHEDGIQRDFLPIFDGQLAEDYGKVPLGGEASIGRTNIFDEPTWLIGLGGTPMRIGRGSGR